MEFFKTQPHWPHLAQSGGIPKWHAQRKVNGVGGCEWKPGAGRGDFTGECVLGKAALYRLGRIEGGQDVGVFRAYGEHYKKMLQAAGKNKDALNQVLDKLFVTYEDPALTERALTSATSKSLLAKLDERNRQNLAKAVADARKTLQERRDAILELSSGLAQRFTVGRIQGAT